MLVPPDHTWQSHDTRVKDTGRTPSSSMPGPGTQTLQTARMRQHQHRLPVHSDQHGEGNRRMTVGAAAARRVSGRTVLAPDDVVC